jgi:hypothetical protein
MEVVEGFVFLHPSSDLTTLCYSSHRALGRLICIKQAARDWSTAWLPSTTILEFSSSNATVATCLGHPLTQADYMESKRRAFPRFYFVSTADLLDILSNGNNPVRVMTHMSKCFQVRCIAIRLSSDFRHVAACWASAMFKPATRIVN